MGLPPARARAWMARVSVVVATVGIGLLVAAAGTSGNQRSCPTGPAKAPVVEYVAALVCFVVAAAAGMTRFSGPRLDFRWGQKLAYGGVVLSFLVLIQLVTRVCGD